MSTAFCSTKMSQGSLSSAWTNSSDVDALSDRGRALHSHCSVDMNLHNLKSIHCLWVKFGWILHNQWDPIADLVIMKHSFGILLAQIVINQCCLLSAMVNRLATKGKFKSMSLWKTKAPGETLRALWMADRKACSATPRALSTRALASVKFLGDECECKFW